MADTTFTNGVTLTDEDWFNDLNRLHYTIFSDPANAAAAFTAIKQAASTTATGVSELATSAEILTGTDTARTMTPGDFAGNKDISGTGGYYKFPGGLIIQWETLTTDATGDVTWTYSTAFSSAVFAVVCTPRSGDTAHMVSTDTPGTTTCGIHVRAHDDSQPNAAVLFAFAVGV